MAKSIHLAKLSEGVKAWNRWRSEHPRIIPDLEGATARPAVEIRIQDVLSCPGIFQML